MIAVFERRFGPYPSAGYAVVVTADELEIPLEAQGLAVFGSNHIDGARRSERLVAHELAHQWFGNSVGSARWQRHLANEGFACYAEWIWSEESGAVRADALAEQHRARSPTSPRTSSSATPARLMFDDRVYKRGALTLHALRLTIGDDGVLRPAARLDGTARRTAPSSTAEFIELAEARTGLALHPLFDAWLHAKALPALPHAGPR